MVETKDTIPVVGFVGWSGSGKTTLVRKLIPLFSAAAYQVAILKHAHHDFDIDTPGKDSYELRKAGAKQVLVASNQRWALMTEQTQSPDPVLADMLNQFDRNSIDLIIVEGFKHQHFPKIEVFRQQLGKPLLCSDDTDIIAVATDQPLLACATIKTLNLNDPELIYLFLVNNILRKTR